MTIQMSAVVVPNLILSLKNLKAILLKGEAYAEEQNIEPSVLLNTRLFPNMFTLTRQVQIATDVAKGSVYRLTHQQPPSFADEEASFAELYARIDNVIGLLQDFPAADLEGTEDAHVVLKLPNGEMQFNGLDYVMTFVFPNVHFHVTTAYAILRHCGVPLGKMDFLAGAKSL